jgi:hypothetical protein
MSGQLVCGRAVTALLVDSLRIHDAGSYFLGNLQWPHRVKGECFRQKICLSWRIERKTTA